MPQAANEVVGLDQTVRAKIAWQKFSECVGSYKNVHLHLSPLGWLCNNPSGEDLSLYHSVTEIVCEVVIVV